MSWREEIARAYCVTNMVNIRRLLYDAMMYTLPKCGYPEKGLPPPEDEKNEYTRADFVAVVGVCTLRVSLELRDRWMRMFKSRLISSGFNAENIPHFLKTIALCCPLSYLNTAQSMVNVAFALCNEIIMFFHYAVLKIDIGIVINATSKHVLDVITMNPFNPSNVEDLFDRFEKLPQYAEWITDFLTNYAIPYGSRGDTSDLFFEQIKLQWSNLKSNFQEKPTVKIMRGYLGFLPDHLFEQIALEESEESSGHSVLESESKLKSGDESRDSPKAPESGAVGGIELCGRPSPQSVHAAEQVALDKENRNKKLALQAAKVAAQDEENINMLALQAAKDSDQAVQDKRNENCLEAADSIDLESLSLANEGASEEIQSVSPQRKRSNKRKSSKKKR